MKSTAQMSPPTPRPRVHRTPTVSSLPWAGEGSAYDQLPAAVQLFIDAYIEEGTAAEAGRVAGLSETRPRQAGHALLKKPLVQAALRERQEAAVKAVGLSPEKVILDLERLRRKAEQHGQYQHALKASELQGKFLNMWSDNQAQVVIQTDHVQVLEAARERVEAARRRLAELRGEEVPQMPLLGAEGSEGLPAPLNEGAAEVEGDPW